MSMGANSGTKLVKVADNCETVLAIELMNAVQALEFRRPAKTSPRLEELVANYRKVVPFVDNDMFLSPLIHESVAFLKSEKYF